MPHNPADDQPAPSVQQDALMHTAVVCPLCSSAVMVSGPRGAKWLSGSCYIDKKVVYGRAELASQMGTFVAPPDADLEAPPKEDKDAGTRPKR
jgi:hypothetical protein